MNEKCKLSIIVVSYNTKETTDNCLSSIYNSMWKDPFEVIVIDNDSHDGSVEMIKSKYPYVKLIVNEDNKLFAIANNQGANWACGKYLLLLNSDTLVEKDNLQKMLSYFETVPDDVICIGPKVLNMDGTIQSSGYPNPGLRERFCMCFKLHKLLPVSIVELFFHVKGLPHNSNIVREVGWVSGACMMLRAKEYKMIGGLNDKIEFYGEEPEFGYRSKKYHYRTIYYPNAEIIHLGGQSSGKKVDEEIRLRRYALLQRETVGYSKSIWMSRIVLCSAYLKKVILSNRTSLLQAIEWEKKVIDYLQKVQHEETSH